MFTNFPEYVHSGDCIILNKTRVFPARLRGKRQHATGAEIEVFLIRSLPGDGTIWRTLARPAKRARPGDTILFSDDLKATVLQESAYGERTLQFHFQEDPHSVFERIGSVPLPPYIHRTPGEKDRERYQTVFASSSGSAAAPTAGLHFTPEILDRCRNKGAEIAFVTLHVGLGTFAPLRENDLSKIQLHEEFFEIEEAEAAKMRRAQRRLCVGTTTVRTVETAMLRGGLQARQGETNLFISPGFSFGGAHAMLTNFHLPQSSLLILVSAFAERELILKAYQHAVSEKYKFFSYGDCMLII